MVHSRGKIPNAAASGLKGLKAKINKVGGL
jgi:hypothetical protein